ncbi:hypothetical protein PAXRUDRAFT_480445 [Paxillus rubicundulus Ve08.2h10]|uniref:Unplaced genomic scaffold scaffold_314, whole genome shotgun sequence n=1 Tax=Paxillus rubicundulus Ve08.2h10 TaxID=930991 RepID=A0A0D0E7I0_9AGAM|nr:hypothetical protein PAXRUDRAFT_480445 [Paxillus rubicundulus Ve08.2h10]
MILEKEMGSFHVVRSTPFGGRMLLRSFHPNAQISGWKQRQKEEAICNRGVAPQHLRGYEEISSAAGKHEIEDQYDIARDISKSQKRACNDAIAPDIGILLRPGIFSTAGLSGDDTERNDITSSSVVLVVCTTGAP